MKGNEIAITGIGLVTPLGIGLEVNWNRAIEGKTATKTDDLLGDLPVSVSCRVPGFDPTALGVPNEWQWDRFAQFALVASLQALEDAGLEPKKWNDDSRVAVIIGSGAGGTATLEEQHQILLKDGVQAISPITLPKGLLNMATGQVATELGARGPCIAPCTACAAGTSAIGIAMALLRSGIADIVIAGGAEAPITPLYTAAFSKMRALSRNPDPLKASRPFDKNRDGFVLGEGAGVFVLETPDHAKKRGARVHANIIGYGASADAYHVTSPHPQGLGAKYAMRAALRDAGIPFERVGYVNAHGTSTPGNDATESKAIEEIFGSSVIVSSTKGVTGHLLGGGGPVEAALTVLSLQKGQFPMTAGLADPDPKIGVDLIYGKSRSIDCVYALSNSFGFGGQNASLLLSRIN